MFAQFDASPLQQLHVELLKEKGVELWLKRDDLLHPEVQGNKWRKLKYNLINAKDKGMEQLLTFGGPFSNHVYATAAAANLYGFKSIGIIRGYESATLSPTLAFAQSKGMQLVFLDKTQYREKESDVFFKEWENHFGPFVVIPEGGTNLSALPGVAEVVKEIDIDFDFLCTACGTGGTIAGLLAQLNNQKQVLGFSALKGDGDLAQKVDQLVLDYTGSQFNNYIIRNDFHFGGYAKITSELVQFIQSFKQKTGVLLDPVYTGKMMYGIFDLIRKDYFQRGTCIVALHTGGLQGWSGYPDMQKLVLD
jgi:1-aminocyclopropane-1-carboxylate deaminase/D-cysteine desulfhydrase-like pyridoxal-dependent ACC family enzyme